MSVCDPWPREAATDPSRRYRPDRRGAQPARPAGLAGGEPIQQAVGLAGVMEEAHVALPALRRGRRGTAVLGLDQQRAACCGRRPDQHSDRPAQPRIDLVGSKQGQGRRRPRFGCDDRRRRAADPHRRRERHVGFLDEVERLELPPDPAAALGDRIAEWETYPRTVRRGTLEWIKAGRTGHTREKRIAEVVAALDTGRRPAPFRR